LRPWWLLRNRLLLSANVSSQQNCCGRTANRNDRDYCSHVGVSNNACDSCQTQSAERNAPSRNFWKLAALRPQKENRRAAASSRRRVRATSDSEPNLASLPRTPAAFVATAVFRGMPISDFLVLGKPLKTTCPAAQQAPPVRRRRRQARSDLARRRHQQNSASSWLATTASADAAPYRHAKCHC
jgi:hypothetical protein